MHARGIVLVVIAAAGPGCGLEDLVDTDLGDAPACADLSVWPSASAELEEDLAVAVDELRRRGTSCGGDVELPGEGPVELVAELRCAARQHAGDLARREGLAHDGSDGSTTLSRVNLSGYDGITRHELLASDYLTSQDVLESFVADPAHCSFIMDENLDHIGVGHARSPERDRIVWVLVTGERRE